MNPARVMVTLVVALLIFSSVKADCRQGYFPDGLGGCIPCSYCNSENPSKGCDKCATVTTGANADCKTGHFSDGLGGCAPCSYCDSENPPIGCEKCNLTDITSSPYNSADGDVIQGDEVNDESLEKDTGMETPWWLIVVVAVSSLILVVIVYAGRRPIYNRYFRTEPRNVGNSITDDQLSQGAILDDDNSTELDSVVTDCTDTPNGSDAGPESFTDEACATVGECQNHSHTPVQESLRVSNQKLLR